MNYTKPEVAVLGTAVRVIEQFPQVKGTLTQLDLSARKIANPAYDLDE